ncbi:MAG: hypothetical protein JJE55_06400 [Flavobacteriaceae bacterium]|nr:hypothetical protein [Flavobacteriaceae bacterium]
MKPTTNIKLQDILYSLSNDGERERVFNILKNRDPIDDEVKGVKLFLENNNYDRNLLEGFLSKPKFENLIHTTKHSKSGNNLLKYVATFIILIGLGSLLVFNNLNSSSKLYSKYYQEDVGLPVFMSSNSRVLFNESMNAYKDDDFKSSLNGFEKLLQNNPKNDTLNYYLGCSYLEINELEKSILSFQKVDDNSVFKEKSEFRLALVYLKKNDYEKSKKILSLIQQNKKNTYYSVSKKMLEESVFK